MAAYDNRTSVLEILPQHGVSLPHSMPLSASPDQIEMELRAVTEHLVKNKHQQNKQNLELETKTKLISCTSVGYMYVCHIFRLSSRF